MKIPICLIGADTLALASLKQQLDKDAAFSVEGRAYAYGDAFEGLRNKSGPIIAVIDLNQDPQRAFGVAEEIKFKLPSIRLIMTSNNGAQNGIGRRRVLAPAV